MLVLFPWSSKFLSGLSQVKDLHTNNYYKQNREEYFGEKFFSAENKIMSQNIADWNPGQPDHFNRR